MATKNLEVFNKIRDRRGAVSHSVENGVVRMKILVKRQEVQQVLEQVTNRKGDYKRNHVNFRLVSASKTLEQRLKDMRRMRILRSKQMKGDCRSYWRPALESIPEVGVM
ncbi:hypothetical protein L1987_32211 [Smallanthus sonchifolius]|uniref:Uncharacterized protein n=1 Tax=Smallanthus sonchifolius TaxID=185202 RepID=A0ACB9I8L9_9ASTR|nr:hypothetical protein L1987_32211 [Smallanthus sonchifolius]